MLEEHRKQLAESNTLVKRNDYDIENKLILKEKEIYEKIVAERKNEMSTLNNKLNKINYMINHMSMTKYHFKSENRLPISFDSFNLPLGWLYRSRKSKRKARKMFIKFKWSNNRKVGATLQEQK